MSRYLVRDQLFGTASVSHHQGPKTLVPEQTMTPSKNPKTFMHQDKRLRKPSIVYGNESSPTVTCREFIDKRGMHVL